MTWNYFALPNNNIIIGYNLGSEEGFENVHDGWRREQKYRPDQEEGNTGLKGRWIHRLESNTESVINSKQV